MLAPSDDNDGSSLWSLPSVEAALYEKLNDRTAANFLENVEAMYIFLLELSEYFPVEADSKVLMPVFLRYQNRASNYSPQ